MSFYVQRGKNREILSVKEALELTNLEQFSFDEGDEDFDFDEFYGSKISDYECLIFGEYELSPFGFEFAFDKQHDTYNTRITTPATSFDWGVMLEFLKALAEYNGEKIITENGDELAPNEVSSIDYQNDIISGLEVLKRHLQSDDTDTLNKFGIIHTMALDGKILEKIFNAQDSNAMIKNYDEFCQKQQFSGGYFAKQSFYQDNENGQIFGVYVLSQGVDTILPYKPGVEFDYEIKNNQISRWQLVLMASVSDDEDDEFDMAGEVDYQNFMANLPKDRYRFLDANYIYIEAATKEEILNWAKYK